MELKDLKGLGPKRIKILNAVGIRNVPDLLRYIPRDFQDRTQIIKIGELLEDTFAVCVGEVVDTHLADSYKPRFHATLQDDSGQLELTFFHYVEGWSKKLQRGKRFAVIGKVQFFRGPQMVHPELIPLKANEKYKGEIVPIYPLTEDMRASRMEQNYFRKLIPPLFEKPLVRKLFPGQEAPELVRDSLGMVKEFENLRKLHHPQSLKEIYEAVEQLKKMELLPFSMRMVQRRERMKARGSTHCKSCEEGKYARFLKDALPFGLTQGQEDCLQTIRNGMAEASQYQALVQGDVGSGKTVIALLAMAEALELGEQVAIMAPTDILARQHLEFFQPLLSSLGIHVSLLTGDLSGRARNEVLYGIETGSLQCVIGTHALFSKDVQYHHLGFIVIDEQHRFGVGQREALLQKGNYPDVVVMSATPIPRSLTMTLYGDLEAVVLKEKPAGRKEVKTRLVSNDKREDMKKYILKEVQEGNQCYWIVPRVEDMDDYLKSVEAVVLELRQYSAEWQIDFVHGRVDEEHREKRLKDFSEGRIQILVATTVVEVGVNVPNANLIVMEQPERFGLAQLHQLRGRVGRGDKQAWCFLNIDPSNASYERIQCHG